LGTFTEIRGPVVARANKAVLDLSAALGEDLYASAHRLGMVLDDPIAGLSTLAAVGIKFNRVQREQIEALVYAGKITEAQAIILQKLENRVGGVAEAVAKASVGWDKVSLAAGRFKTELGVGLTPAIKDMNAGTVKLLETLTKAVAAFNKLHAAGVKLGKIPVWKLLLMTSGGPAGLLTVGAYELFKKKAGKEAVEGGPEPELEDRLRGKKDKTRHKFLPPKQKGPQWLGYEAAWKMMSVRTDPTVAAVAALGNLDKLIARKQAEAAEKQLEAAREAAAEDARLLTIIAENTAKHPAPAVTRAQKLFGAPEGPARIRIGGMFIPKWER